MDQARQELLRQNSAREDAWSVDVPDAYVGDPPAGAVPEEFEAINRAAFGGPSGFGHVFGGAENVNAITGAMGDAVDFMLVKGFAGERGITAIDKFRVGHGASDGVACGVFAEDDEPDIGNIERGASRPHWRG